MKKSISATLIAASLLMSTTAAFAQDSPITVYVDDRPISFQESPTIVEGTTLVPFRPIFEQLGIGVSWDGSTQTVSGQKDRWSIQLTIGQTQAVVNGQAKTLPVPAQIINGYTFVPLRFIGEATGRGVAWDNETKIIQINPTLISQTNDILYSKDLRYEGDLKGDVKDGKGKYYYKNEIWYEGDFKANRMEGYGKQYDPDNRKSYYEGQFINNLSQGQGKMIYDDGSYYEGPFKEGARDGDGKLNYASGKLKYEGKYVNNVREGLGKYYLEDGSLFYEGEFKDGTMDGLGKSYMAGHLSYEGEFVKGKQQGKGKLYSPKQPYSLWYEGDFKDDHPDGAGKMYGDNNRLKYEGIFKSYKLTGEGKIYYDNGQVYEGEVYNNKAEGMGTLYDASGKAVSSGYFKNDIYNGEAPADKDESFIIAELKKSLKQKVIDGMTPNSYHLNPTEAIMLLDLPTQKALEQFQQLPDNAKKQFMNGYAQEHWGDVLGVRHCYTKVTYQGTVYAEADLSYQIADDAVKLTTYPKGK
ncbi:hypothetical protein GCM10023310_03800 [Paenibacillus vulneris]|uniref:Stalk domain-containing protein n=1 Tax=Paenibacillus vulneris TaxID=1133364 RepID=A0ABW3UKP6_9BACL